MTDGLTELWTITCNDGEWKVVGVFLDGEKEVGSFVAEKEKLTEEGLEFVQKFVKNPPRVWSSGASYTTKLEDGKLSYTWRIAGGSGTRVMTKIQK